MGLIDMAAGAAQGAGTFAAGAVQDSMRADIATALKEQEAQIQRDRDAALRSFTSEENALSRKHQTNIETSRQAAESGRHAETIGVQKQGLLQQQRRDENAQGLDQMRLDIQSQDSARRAKHDELSLEIQKLQAGASVGASASQRALAEAQLGNLKKVTSLRDDWTKAIDSGDTKAIASVKKKIEAMNYNGDKNDTSGALAIAGVAAKIAADMDTPAPEKEYWRNVAQMATKSAMGEKDISVNGPARPKTEAEMLALPDGTEFINPSNGQVLRKKSSPQPTKAAPGEFDKQFPASRGLIGTAVPPVTTAPDTSGNTSLTDADLAKNIAVVRGRYVINTPYRLTNGRNDINGQKYSSKEEAIAALRNAMSGGQ